MKISKVDPCRHYSGVRPEALLESCGLLHSWATEALAFEDNIMDSVIESYGMYFGDSDGFLMLADDGAILCCGDPPLYPYVEYENDTVIFRIYPDAFVSQLDKGTRIARFGRME